MIDTLVASEENTDLVQIIGSRGVGVGELNKPRSVAVDRADDLYVVDMTGRVQEFSPSSVFVRSWELPQTDKGKPKGMCRDQEGNIVVVEPHYQRVNHFSTEGKLLGQWGQYGTNDGQFTMPRAVAVNSRGEAFVSEYGLVERVQRFGLTAVGPVSRLPPGADTLKGGHQTGEEGGTAVAPGPKFLSGFGRMGSGPGEFNRPEGLCVDSQDQVYVADSCNHRIQIFSSDGKFIRAHGKAGTGKGELSYPYDICVDAAGSQYVCGRVDGTAKQQQPCFAPEHQNALEARSARPTMRQSVGPDVDRRNLYAADLPQSPRSKFLRKAVASNGIIFSIQNSELTGRAGAIVADERLLGETKLRATTPVELKTFYQY
jgi:sugar lactone lactonase YvrE